MVLQVDTSQTVTDDQFDATGYAIEFITNPDITVTIDTNVSVISEGDYTVYSNVVGSTLINNGSILSTASYGVEFEAASGSVVNDASGLILGVLEGVDMTEADASVINHGVIKGLQTYGVFFSTHTDNAVLNNDGEIFGRDSAGVATFNSDGGMSITNSGTISSEGIGVRVTGLGNPVPTDIDNKAGGLIKGDTLGIFVSNGALSLDNRGTVDGNIDCNGSDRTDVVTNRGDINGDVFLGSGDDEFTGIGGSSSGDVFGEDGNDTLIGGNANDTLDGGPGSDLLRGGAGRDSLFGGADDDIFDFNSKKDSKKGGKRDTIKDFDRSDDIIDLKTIDAKQGGGNQAFKWIGKHDFHDKKGELHYVKKGSDVIVEGDINGNGKADFQIRVDDLNKLTAGDFEL